LLPAADIPAGLQEIRVTICNDMQMAQQLQQLVTYMYVQSHWIDTRNVTTSTDLSDKCEVCMSQPRAGVAPVPCGHSRFCASCADIVASMDMTARLADLPSQRALRSANTSRLIQPQSNRSTVGDRAFSVAGPQVWNSLPPEVTSARSLDTFRRRLKTHLFTVSYSNIQLS